MQLNADIQYYPANWPKALNPLPVDLPKFNFVAHCKAVRLNRHSLNVDAKFVDFRKCARAALETAKVFKVQLHWVSRKQMPAKRRDNADVYQFGRHLWLDTEIQPLSLLAALWHELGHYAIVVHSTPYTDVHLIDRVLNWWPHPRGVKCEYLVEMLACEATRQLMTYHKISQQHQDHLSNYAGTNTVPVYASMYANRKHYETYYGG